MVLQLHFKMVWTMKFGNWDVTGSWFLMARFHALYANESNYGYDNDNVECTIQILNKYSLAKSYFILNK